MSRHTPPNKTKPSSLTRKTAHLEGAALIIVLAFLIILTGMTVAFLSSVTNEASSTASAASAVNTRTLADTAVQLTIAQIRDATAGFAHDTNGGLTTTSTCWASQPGAIRTYDTNAANVAVYKLYSALKMVDTNASCNPSTDAPSSSSWATSPALYSDLNAPVVTGTNTNYPILDPYMTNSSNGFTLVDGFSISNAPVSTNGGGVSATNAAPMPVAWLYMLRDGSVIAPDSSSTTNATFISTPTTNQPSSNNPIIGRIAFWTDDETCKLNINTASEGSFWGTPSFTTLMDVSMALTPPVNREYNRYPGHPASTSLSPVLWSFFGLSNPASFTGFLPGNPTNAYNISEKVTSNSLVNAAATNYYTNLFGIITPRYLWGGSASGVSNTMLGANSIPRSSLPTGRLYASVDELFFSPTNSIASMRTNNSYGGGGGGLSIGSGGSGVIAPLDISRLRFFLTAESRAPEVNPLNLPKITMWPVPDTNHTMTANPQSKSAANTRTLIDQTIAFCSTLGTNSYYFTRYDSTDPTNDCSVTKTPRNVTLYNYLRNQMDLPIPGFTGALKSSSKWNALQADQISTQLFDYIRSCINLVDSSSLNIQTATANLSNSYQYAYTYPPTNTIATNTNGYTTNVSPQAGTGQVIPIFINNPDGNVTKGLGRFPTIRSGLLWFIARGADQPPLMVYSDRKPIVYNSSGQEISTNISGVSSIPSNNLSTVLNGGAYARVNPMHPWTCPQTSSVTIGGYPSVPQLTSGGFAILADTNGSVAGNRFLTIPAHTSEVYPIFNLTNGSGSSPYTYTYPTINMSNTIITNFPSATQYTFYTKSPAIVPNKINAYYVATNNSVTTNANITHGGLPYLTIQNITSGSFDMTNKNYKDSSFPATSFSPHQTRMEAVFLPSLAQIAPGAAPYDFLMKVQVSGLNSFTVNGASMGFPTTNTTTLSNSVGQNACTIDTAGYGLGMQGFFDAWAINPTLFASNFPVVNAAAPTGEPNGATFSFGGGPIVIALSTASNTPLTVQTINMNFPSAVFPTPKLPPYVYNANFPPTNAQTTITVTTSNSVTTTNAIYPGMAGHRFLTFVGNSTNPLFTQNGTVDDGANPYGVNSYNPGIGYGNIVNWIGVNVNQSASDRIPSEAGTFSTNNSNWFNSGYKYAIPYTMESVEALYGDTRMIAALTNVPASFYTTNPYYGYSNSVTTNGWPMYVRNGYSLQEHSTYVNGSIVGSLLPSDATPSANNWTYLSNYSGYSVNANPAITTPPSGTDAQKIFFTANNTALTILPFTTPTCDFKNPTFASIWARGGDYDNGFGYFPDGPFINKVDEGYGVYNTNNQYGSYGNPYFNTFYQPSGSTLLSANRMVPSPVIMGSLPVGFAQMNLTNNNMLTNSWLTLQFSVNPNSPSTTTLATRNSAAGYNESGATITNPIVPDHVLLDFFQMPVVEPYPISDPFSTAGKVNMNYQIVPFSYVTRDSAMRGVLKAVQITAVDESYAGVYKYPGNFSFASYPAGTNYNQLAASSGNFYFNYPIQATETLKQFTNRFGQNDLFRSPSEICALWLYPAKQPTTLSPSNNTNAVVLYTNNNSNIKSWWYDNPSTSRKGLTGDNLRERPYSYLYPRLTTKSNTYQIHYRVQTLKQTRTAHPTDYLKWIDPGTGSGVTDKVVGELRGSAIIERYIDPSDTTLPDFTTFVTSGGSMTNSMDSYYKFRVFNVKQFNP